MQLWENTCWARGEPWSQFASQSSPESLRNQPALIQSHEEARGAASQLHSAGDLWTVYLTLATFATFTHTVSRQIELSSVSISSACPAFHKSVDSHGLADLVRNWTGYFKWNSYLFIRKETWEECTAFLPNKLPVNVLITKESNRSWSCYRLRFDIGYLLRNALSCDFLTVQTS